MEFDIKELSPINNIGDKADIRIKDKQAVYEFDGTNWILMVVWELVDSDMVDVDKIITPDICEKGNRHER